MTGDEPGAPVAAAGGIRVELGRLAALVGVAGVAIAQPVLSAFGQSPETFVFRDAEGVDLVLFALAVVLVPPVVVWWVGVVIGVLAPRWRVLVHGASIGLFVALAGVQVLGGGLPQALALALSIGFAVGAWVLTVRSGAFRLWSELLVALPVLALVVFLVASPASDVVTGADFAAATTTGEAAPVVLIVLDELPTASIIDGDGAIDAVRFPNLARLAGEATWYRNHTTQSGFTNTAVPAIFTGRSPENVPPLFTQQPDNIFRLLAGSHDLVASEALTRLCPTSVCGETPQAPASSGAGSEAASAGGSGPAMGSLFHDALDLWVERAGGTDDETADLGDFEESVDSVPSSASSSFGEGEAPTANGSWQEAVASQPTRLTDFLAALQPGDRPLAAVLHLVSPHFPWRYLPDGRAYADPAKAADLPINGGDVPWVADLERQRHLLQASYADRLVGQVLQRLDEIGVYDDAAIAVTADHGVAFAADENRRLPVPEALPELMWTPLIVKAPGQSEPAVDDGNVQSIDVLPTLASLIGVEIPWAVDGVDAAGDGPAARGDRKEFRRYENEADPNPASRVEVDGAAGFAAMLDMAFPSVGADDDPVRALYSLSGRPELIGQAYEPSADVARDALVVDDLDRLAGSRDPVVVLTGTVHDGGRGAEHVVASIDGQVVAVSPVVPRADGGPAFALLLPTGGPVDLRQVRLGFVAGSDVFDAGPVAT